jgi:hypothetical protein
MGLFSGDSMHPGGGEGFVNLHAIAKQWVSDVSVHRQRYWFTHFFLAGNADRTDPFIFTVKDMVGAQAQVVRHVKGGDTDLARILNDVYKDIEHAPGNTVMLIARGFEQSRNIKNPGKDKYNNNRAAHDWVQDLFQERGVAEKYRKLGKHVIIVTVAEDSDFKKYEAAKRSFDSSELDTGSILVLDDTTRPNPPLSSY